MPSSPLADLLGQYLQSAQTSVNRLAKLSDVPQRTIANWLNGFIQKPHQWQALIKVALALHLNIFETNKLLQTAGHASLTELRAEATAATDKKLLSHFQFITHQASPFQAIADLPTFIGRTSELDDLKQALLENGRAAICGLSGMGGVGKTSLAAHLAYQLQNEFPDGVLWARLDTSDSLSILGTFADAYGKDVSQYKDIEGRASIVRSLLAQKRTLIILDNAETSAQVRPLLPPSTGNSVVLITTRHDLSALDGWKQLILKPFSAESGEALQLFEIYMGKNFVHLYHSTLLEIADLLGYLPLALSIAAGQLVNNSINAPHKTNTVIELRDSLLTTQKRLDILTRDDLGVRISFDVSYTTLLPGQKKLFAILGIFSGKEFGSDAVTYLIDGTPETAEEELKHLQALSLIQESRSGYWRLHPLLRDYSREQLETNGWLNQIVEKTLLMYQQAAQGKWSFTNSLDAEILNSRFAFEQASQLKLHRPFIETARALFPTFFNGAWFSLAYPIMEQARMAAQALGDQEADIYFIRGLAIMQMGLGDNINSKENLLLALKLAQSANRNEAMAEILMSIGKLEIDMGYQKQALAHFEQSLALAKEISAQNIIGPVISNIALVLTREARYKEAEAMYLESLELVRAQKNENAIVVALMNLGDVAYLQEEWERANVYSQEALSLAFAGKHRAAASGLLVNVALIHAHRGEWEEAHRLSKEAIHLAQEINSPRMESAVRGEFGSILIKQKEFDEALHQLIQANDLAVEIGDLERIGVVNYYLGLAYLALMQTKKAQTALNKAFSSAQEVEHEILIADVCFAQAKVALANKEQNKAKQWAQESQTRYKKINLTRQSEEVLHWSKTLD